jgi:hypothetical protein
MQNRAAARSRKYCSCSMVRGEVDGLQAEN